MRRLNPIILALAAGVLALLLIFYVFAGKSGRRENPDKLSDTQVAGASSSAPSAACSAQETNELIKGELFRRAAALAQAEESVFGEIEPLSVVRMASPRSSDIDEGTRCEGALTLDVWLPPGMAAVEGRRALSGDVAYTVGDDGSLLALDNAGPIIASLAQLAPAANRQDEEEPISGPEPSAPATPEPRTIPPQAETPRAAPPPPAPKPAPAQRPAPKVTKPAPEPTPPARATASPSFNCRHARTRGEIAVCNDAGLASLDREMASQFSRAMAAATPAQRSLLQRTRGAFLRFRDSCGTNACMAGAYRDRMREIADIMARQWNPN